MNTPEKLSLLRSKMQENHIDAFVVFSADPHLSEYLPKEWLERAWLSGFTGSAGFVVVTKDKAGLWTDSRYFVQSAIELKGSGIDLFKDGVEGTPRLCRLARISTSRWGYCSTQRLGNLSHRLGKLQAT